MTRRQIGAVALLVIMVSAITAWVAYRRGRVRRAALCGVAAVVAGFASFAMPHSEVERLLLGYYLGQASLLCFAAASAWCWWRNAAHRGRHTRLRG